MIEATSGDLLKADVEALVNAVNCAGVMGKGIALEFKRAFPANFQIYEKACRVGNVVPGRMLIHEIGGSLSPRYIINFPTKRHWRDGCGYPSSYPGRASATLDEATRLRLFKARRSRCGLMAETFF